VFYLYLVCHVKRKITESFLENEQREQNVKDEIHGAEKLKAVRILSISLLREFRVHT